MPRAPLLILSLFFLIGGLSHFIVADAFVKTIPDYLAYPRELVIISGVFELVGAIGLLIPSVRLVAGYGLIALCIAVFPANINMALHPERFPEVAELFLYSRLPIQILFIWFIWWAIRPERLQYRNANE